MTATELALVVAVISSVAMTCVSAVIGWRLAIELRESRRASAELRIAASRLITELEHTLDGASHDVDRIDSLLDAAEAVQHTVDGVTQLTRDTVASPLIRARAFLTGTGRAARRLRRVS